MTQRRHLSVRTSSVAATYGTSLTITNAHLFHGVNLVVFAVDAVYEVWVALLQVRLDLEEVLLEAARRAVVDAHFVVDDVATRALVLELSLHGAALSGDLCSSNTAKCFRAHSAWHRDQVDGERHQQPQPRVARHSAHDRESHSPFFAIAEMRNHSRKTNKLM